MTFKGTDLNAWDKAKKGKTAAEKSKIYRKAKAENQRKTKKYDNYLFAPKRKTSSTLSSPKLKQTSNNLAKTKTQHTTDIMRVPQKIAKAPTTLLNNCRASHTKYAPQQLLLDDLRNYRSSKMISNISNTFATIVARSIVSKKASNNDINYIRSLAAFATAEVLNKVLERPMKIVDNIKLFIKAGKAIYKIILWFNENTKEYEIKDNQVIRESAFSREYQAFKKLYPQIIYSTTPQRLLNSNKALISVKKVKEKWIKVFAEGLDDGFLKKLIRDKCYLWQIFSDKKIDCLEGNAARKAFNEVIDKDALWFDENDVFCHELLTTESSSDFDGYCEACVIDKNFKWTYITTHEESFGLGPYFCEKTHL